MKEEPTPRKKILFFSHAVTLAHFVRPLRWIECLDLNQHEVYLASSVAFKKMIPKTGINFIEVNCIDPIKFSKIVDQAKPIYDTSTFTNHIEEDLKIIDQVKPDLIIGDFRHSLSVSCRLRKIKYINIANAYWSPEIALNYPMPETPIVRILGEKIFKIFIARFAPVLIKINFFKMVFIVRKSLGLVGLKFNDYRQVITDGDLTVFCDTPGLVPLKKKLSHEIFIGPLIWSMPTPLPDWWGSLRDDKSRIFVSLGSSGDFRLLPMILLALSKLNVVVIVALSGKKISLPQYKDVYITDFIPIEASFQKFSMVICNGGSPMCHSALSYGVPSIGVVSNNDQLLNMAHVQQRGAGIMLRYWNITEETLIAAVQQILTDSRFRESAQVIQNEFGSFDVPNQLRSLVNL